MLQWNIKVQIYLLLKNDSIRLHVCSIHWNNDNDDEDHHHVPRLSRQSL